MAMTATQKILAAHSGLSSVIQGQLIEARLDLVMANDITAPVAIKAFEAAGFKKVFDPSRVVLVLDHFTPCKDIKAARQCSDARRFAGEQGINNFFDVGDMGIEHCLLPEKGLVGPGDCVIGADSHTCTYGALGCFATGVGSTDAAAGMGTGKAWFKVPGAIRFRLSGALCGAASGKDVILAIIGMLGVDGARYKSLEFTGERLESLSMDDRFTIANMAVECGAKNCFFPADKRCIEYFQERSRRGPELFEPDADAVYERTIDIDLAETRPLVALPHSPANVRPAAGLAAGELPINQVVIGSCTNGRISDLRAAAAVLKGKRVAKGVRCIVIPGTQHIYMEALREGLIEEFIKAGAAVSTPTCGPCLGGHMGVLDSGERAISTTNRNFVGRMGHPESEVVLASPATAAASAICGYVTSPEGC